MANMSYCRFENTLRSLQGCVNAIREAFDEGMSSKDFIEGLSSKYEQTAFKQLIQTCNEFVDEFNDWQAGDI